MDLRNLMAQLETFETKKVITESAAPKQAAQPNKAKKVINKSSIAGKLVESFGYALYEADPAGMQATGDDEGNTTITRPDGSTMVVGPDGKQIMPGSNPNLPGNKGVLNTVKNAAMGTGDFQKATGFQPAPGAAAPQSGGTANPMEKDPAQRAQAGTLTTSDGTPVKDGSGNNVQAGTADVGRTPGAAHAGQGGTTPAAPAAATKPAAAQPSGSQIQTDDDGNHMITTPDGKTMVVGPDGNAIKPGSNPNLPANKMAANGVNAQGQNVTMPDGTNPETGEKTTVATPAAPAAPGAPAAPAAAKKPGATPDPKVMALQQELIKKGAKIKADGIMGPQTQAAQQQFASAGTGTGTDGRLTGATDPRVADMQKTVPPAVQASLDAVEKLLTKYKVESVNHIDDFDYMTESEIRSFLMKNVKFLSEADQITFVRMVVTEAPGTSLVPSSGGGALTAPKPSGGLPYTSFRDMPAAPATGMMDKLKGFGKTALKAVSNPKAALAGLAAGGIAAVAMNWDKLKQMVMGNPSMNEADKAELMKHMAVLGQYLKDPKMAEQLPGEMQERIKKVAGRVEKLQGGAPAAPAAPTAPTAPAAPHTPPPMVPPGTKMPAPGGTTTSTQTNTSVQGEFKMGKPSGPITFNGKVVQPGAPEYAAASDALIKAKGSAQRPSPPRVSTPAPVQQGATQEKDRDFESVQSSDDAILERIRALRF